MDIRFLGAARTVTGSMHLIEVNGARILLDCGLFQGRRKEAFERNRQLPFDASKIHNVVLSHAHIDHSGNLPQLTLRERGFRGRIFCTSATKDLCGWMLRDAGHIQERDVEYVNRRRRKKGETPFEPLYTVSDAERCMDFFEDIPYEHLATVGPGVTISFTDAGHILGSAITHLDIEEGQRQLRVVFTGDVGRAAQPILRDPVPPTRADVVISESTYGDRLHEKQLDLREHLGEIVRRTHARGGKVLVPAFSVGRTQHIVYRLHELFKSGELPPLPIYVDSPLSTNVTDVFRAHPECYDADAMAFLEEGADPFGFQRLTYVRDVAESKALNTSKQPAIIIAASGMMESGRVIHHLKRLAPSRRNTILIVGFMAEHTLGRRVVDRVPEIKLFGEMYPLEAEVEQLSGFSSHADRDELTGFLENLSPPPARTFLVHGEEKPAFSFAEHLEGRGFPRVDVPAPGERFSL